MLQKYVASWILNAECTTLGGSEARVLQLAYGSPKAATTTSGAETTLMLGQFRNALGSTVRAVPAVLPAAHGRKTTKAARFTHPAKAFDPMLVTDDGVSRLANALQSAEAFDPMLVTEDGISRLANELHSAKAQASMVVTDDGIARLANELHL